MFVSFQVDAFKHLQFKDINIMKQAAGRKSKNRQKEGLEEGLG
jgi:hypothetical protein